MATGAELFCWSCAREKGRIPLLGTVPNVVTIWSGVALCRTHADELLAFLAEQDEGGLDPRERATES